MATSYEVTDGTKTYGTFSSQSKADALKKELKAKGIAARVRAIHGETPKPATKAVTPKKPATKAKPKTAKAPAKPKTKPAKQPAEDYSKCDPRLLALSLSYLQHNLYSAGQWHDWYTKAPLRKFTHNELEAAMVDGDGLDAVCEAFQHCTLAVATKDGSAIWEDVFCTYEEWKAIEKRLADMRAKSEKTSKTKAKTKPANAPAKTKAKSKPASKPKKPAKKKGPADMVIDPNGDNDVTYLFDNGFIGKFVDEAEIDWDDWDDYDEWGDDVEVAGVMYINLYGPNGEFEEGYEYPYHEGMTLGELCKEGDLPQPVTKILDEFFEALENDCDPKKVFKILDAYLSGKYPDGMIIHDLEYSCKRDVSKNLRRRYRRGRIV